MCVCVWLSPSLLSGAESNSGQRQFSQRRSRGRTCRSRRLATRNATRRRRRRSRRRIVSFSFLFFFFLPSSPSSSVASRFLGAARVPAARSSDDDDDDAAQKMPSALSRSFSVPVSAGSGLIEQVAAAFFGFLSVFFFAFFFPFRTARLFRKRRRQVAPASLEGLGGRGRCCWMLSLDRFRGETKTKMGRGAAGFEIALKDRG